ncbi:MAG: hypothetical protein DMG06_03260 [Acidobacteria bacterium]|nr:MAG: hypothetical protein DMG06_03260 [Acidobacteriota bacterium]
MGVRLRAFTALALFAGLAFPARGQDNPLRFVPAQVISTADAVYPPNVVNPGMVVFEVTVGASGNIENVKVVRDGPGFTGTAQQAVRKWKFKPATFNGQPVRSVVPVAFSFAQPLITQPR